MLQRFLVKPFSFCTLSSVMAMSAAVQADTLSWGDAETDLGKLTVSGWVRANYQDKD